MFQRVIKVLEFPAYFMLGLGFSLGELRGVSWGALVLFAVGLLILACRVAVAESEIRRLRSER